MKTYVKVILALLVVTVVGLTAGLFVVIGSKDDKPDIEGLEIVLNDNHLVDISEEGAQGDKIYSVNLNTTNTFSLKYVAKPLDLEKYLIMVTSSNDAITVSTGSNVQGEQTGVAEFRVNKLTHNNMPVTITFKALSNRNDTLLESSIKVLVTKPSTLRAVEDIKYDGNKVTWSPVRSNTDNIGVNPENIRYAVTLQYKLDGEDKAVVHTTEPNVCEFKLENMPGGFVTGTINSITVQALGDKTVTSDSVVSDEYKFYVMPSPTYEMAEEELTISNIDNNASAVVMYKYVDGTFEKLQYMQKSEASRWAVNSIAGDSKEYEIALYSTVINSKADYVREVNYKEIDGVYYFDSPKSDVCNVVVLETPVVTVDNNDTANLFINNTNISTYNHTKISWNHATSNLAVRAQVKYLVSITNGTNTYSKIVDYGTLGGFTIEPHLYITPEILQECKMSSQPLNEYKIEVKAFLPASESDEDGKETNIKKDGVIVIDSKSGDTAKTTIKEYIPNLSNFNININDAVLTYSIPTNDNSVKLIQEISLLFVSKDGQSQVVITRNSSDIIDLPSIIREDGEYDLFIVYKGENGVVNSLAPMMYKKESVYKTIGAVSNANLNKDGKLTFDTIEDAQSYNLVVTIDNVSYETNVTNISSGFDIIDFLDEEVGYNNIPSNYEAGKDSYKITITSVPNSEHPGWVGADTVVEFYKFASVTNIREDKVNIHNLSDDKIVWDKIDGATAYILEAYYTLSNTKSVVVSNGENFYNYKGTEIDSVLMAGNNSISVKAVGTIIDGIAVLQSDLTTVAITKLATPSNIEIKDDILKWNGNDNGVYHIKITTLGNLKWEGYIENDDGKENALDLSTLGLLNDQTYEITIKRVLLNYFDSEYSQGIFVKKLPTSRLSIVEKDGNYYIVWESITLSSNMVFVTNSSTNITIKDGEDELSGYNVIDLREVSINNSLGLVDVGNYEFTIKLGSSSKYDLLTNSIATAPAYISSDVSRLSIVRLDKPSVNTTNYSINLAGSEFVSGFDVVVSYESATIMSDTLLLNTATINTQDTILEAGTYDIRVVANGNVTSIVNTSSSQFVLDSAPLVDQIIKLDTVEVSTVEDSYKNKIKFTSLGLENVEYQIFAKYNDIDGYKLLTKSVDYIVTADGLENIVNFTNVVSGLYYIVAVDNDETIKYLSSNISEVVEVKNINFTNSLIEFVDEDVVSWADTYSNDLLVSAKHYLTIVGDNCNIVYIITSKGNSLDKVTVSGIEELTIDITEDYDEYGLTFDSSSGVYTYNLAYLKKLNKLIEGKAYKVQLNSVGNTINSTHLIVYNNISTADELDIVYYSGCNVISLQDYLTINYSSIHSDYTVMILRLTDSDDNDEEFVISLNSSGAVVGNNDSTMKYQIVDRQIIIDLEFLASGTYTAVWKLNKDNRLGLATADSFVLTFEKVKDFDNSQETMSLDEGRLYINNPLATRTYLVYSVDNGGNILSLLGSYTKPSTEDKIVVNTALWTWKEDSNELLIRVQIKEQGKIISNLSQSYLMTKVLGSTLSTSLDYEDNTNLFDLKSYIVSWQAQNLNTTTDLASGYIIKLYGAVTEEIIYIESNTSTSFGTNSEHNVVYDNGTYQVTLNADSISLLLDKTKELKIELCEVVGNTVDNITNTTTNLVSNFAISNKGITYLPTSSEIDIESGVIKLGQYSYGATKALINFYKLEDDVYSTTVSYYTTLTKEELEVGAEIDLSDISLDFGTYKIAISYIGNSTNIVSSDIYYQEGITKSVNATMEVVDGKLYVTNTNQKIGTIYSYTVYVDGVENLTGSINITQENNVGMIDSAILPAGDFDIEVRVINPNEIASEVVSKRFYKNIIIDNLTKSISYQTNSQSLDLIFTAKNIYNSTDRVSKYQVKFQDKFDNSRYIIREYEATGSSNGVYTIKIADLSTTILRDLGNQVLVSVVELGGDEYIENLEIEAGKNIVEIDKLYSPNERSIAFSDGDMVIRTYNEVTNNTTEIVPDIVTITFVKDDKSYLYTINNFDKLEESLIVDFTKKSVFDGTNWVILPGNNYNIYLQYISSNEEIIDSAIGLYAKGKADTITSISLTNTTYTLDTIIFGSNQSAVYNYLIYLDGEVVCNGTNKDMPANNRLVFDDLDLQPNKYQIAVQMIDERGLKSDYSEAFDFVKLSPITLSAEVIKTTDEYYIEVEFTAPTNNYKNQDLATSYNMSINNKNYIIQANRDSQVYASNGGVDSTIYVTYLEGTYTIKIPIIVNNLLTIEDAGSSNGIIADSEAGLVSIGGIGNNFADITIKVSRIVGNNAGLVLSNNTSDIATCKLTLSKISTSGTKLELVDGLLTYSEAIALDKSLTKVSFYKVINEAVYSLTPTYEWEITESSAVLDITSEVEDFDFGNYLVAIKHYGNVDANVLDSDVLYMVSSTKQVFRALESPQIYIDNGVLMWTAVEVQNVDTRYELTIYNAAGEVVEIERNGLITDTFYDTSSFAPDEYTITIRAIADGCIKSKSSGEFVATKLDSPNVYDIINSQSAIVKEDRVIKLYWKPIAYATGYVVNDYLSVDNITQTTVSILADEDSDSVYEFTINLDVLEGKHYYYVIANGTESTIINTSGSVTYQTSGYLTSFNSYNNSNNAKVTSTNLIANTVEDIYNNNGIVNWDKVDYVDYYKLYIVACDEAGNEIKQYITSTKETNFDITKITDLDINLAPIVKVYVENKTISSDYIVVSTTASRPLKGIVLFNNLTDTLYANLGVDNGMLFYSITSNNINNFVDIINANKDESVADLTCDITNLFDEGDNYLTAFVTPVVTINGKDYRLGTDITNHIFVIDGVQHSYLDWDKVIDPSVTSIDVYIPIPGTLPKGDYKVTLRGVGNTTTTAKEVAIANSIQSETIEGYKLDRPKTPFVNNKKNNIIDGVLKFTPSAALNSSKYIMVYQLTFSSSKDSVDSQSAQIFVTTDQAKLYTNVVGDYYYSGYYDTTHNIISVDIYGLFAQRNINISGSTDIMFEDFVPLQYDTEYYATVRALAILVGDKSNSGFELTDEYFNSNSSSLNSTFTILGAPELSVADECINWSITDGVISYEVYYYSYDVNTATTSKEPVYIDVINTIPDDVDFTNYIYDNFRNNPNITAGIYNIKVVAVGDESNILSSRLFESKDFIVQKMDSVEISVVDGVYTWKNVQQLITKDGDRFKSVSIPYLYYKVRIFANGVIDETKDFVIVENRESGSEQTVFELPENYPSKDPKTGEYINYQIVVYAYTNIAYREYLLPSDDTYDQERTRSSELSGNDKTNTFRIDTNGDISWFDSNDNNYILFVTNSAGEQFITKPLSTKKANIYELYDVNNVKLNIKPDTYNIKIKAIDKTLYTDTIINDINVCDAILRSVYTYSIDVQTILQPQFVIKEGEISWATTQPNPILGSELARTRIVISGNFTVAGGAAEKTTIWIEVDDTTTSFTLETLLTSAVMLNAKDVSHYIYPAKELNQKQVAFIEGEIYDISIRFIGVENSEIAKNSNVVLISSQESLGKIELLDNPKAPVNPTKYEQSEVAEEQAIYHNIPKLIQYNNYIFWNYSVDSSGSNIYDYNIEIFARTKDKEGVNIVNAEMLYKYQLRNIVPNSNDYTINLYDCVKTVYVDNVARDSVNSNIDVNGVYLAIDKVLNLIVSESFDFSITDICIYVEAVGDTETTPINSTSQTYNVVYHYNNATKLKIENNKHVMAISLPAIPTGLSYNGEGVLSWDKVDKVGYQLAVAYEKTNKTISSYNHSNIKQRIKITNSSIVEIDKDGNDTATVYDNNLAILTLLNLTNEEYSILFNFTNNSTKVYYIDVISIDSDRNSYNLKYLTKNIRAFALRAVGVMDAGDLTNNTFVSNPATIKYTKSTSTEFDKFISGDGSKLYPFVIPTISSLPESYIEEYCYYDIIPNGKDKNTTKDVTESISDWTTIGSGKTFNGIIDGNNINYIINYRKIETGIPQIALFYRIGETAQVKNINIKVNHNIDYSVQQENSRNYIFNVSNNSAYFGTVAIYNNGLIANVNVTGYIGARSTSSSNDAFVAGLAVYNYGTIAYCDVSATIDIQSNKNRIGGIAVVNGDVNTGTEGIINTCSFSGVMCVSSLVGGIVDTIASGSIINCINSGYIVRKDTPLTYGGVARYINNRIGSTYYNVVISESTVDIQGVFVGSDSLEEVKIGDSYYVLSKNSSNINFGGIWNAGGYIAGSNNPVISISNVSIRLQEAQFGTSTRNICAITNTLYSNGSLIASFKNVKYHNANFDKLASDGENVSGISSTSNISNSYYNGTNKSSFDSVLESYNIIYINDRVEYKPEI